MGEHMLTGNTPILTSFSKFDPELMERRHRYRWITQCQQIPSRKNPSQSVLSHRTDKCFIEAQFAEQRSFVSCDATPTQDKALCFTVSDRAVRADQVGRRRGRAAGEPSSGSILSKQSAAHTGTYRSASLSDRNYLQRNGGYQS